MAKFLFGDSPDVFEVTLRDGSYLIDFQFTAEDTALIAGALENIGFRWIEIGHGFGLNAAGAGKRAAAATDEEYLATASQILKKAKWGMFFIPGIGREKDLRLAARYGMNFVRIGTNITELEGAQKYFEKAKDLGFIVSYNAMKSYAVPPAEFAEKAARAHAWGADIVYLVDSAGCMYPDDICQYFTAVKNVSDVPLGFHGHDNLSFAMANTLRAVECGAVLVDASLQGMGRSAGNAATEILVAILKQKGKLRHIDLKDVMDVGRGLIGPLMPGGGLDPLAVIAGYAHFHSSYTAKVQQYAAKYELDVRDLIMKLCQKNQVSAPDELLEKLSRELAAGKTARTISTPILERGGAKTLEGRQALISLLKNLRPHAVKNAKYSAINVVNGQKGQRKMVVSQNIQSTRTHVIGSVTLSREKQLEMVLKIVDGGVDVVFLDVDPTLAWMSRASALARKKLRQSQLLTYSDSQVWVNAIEQQVLRVLHDEVAHRLILIAGDHPKSRFLALRLAERGAKIVIWPQKFNEQVTRATRAGMTHLSLSPKNLNLTYIGIGSHFTEIEKILPKCALVVVWPEAEPWFGKKEIRYMSRGTYLIDAGIGSITRQGLNAARRGDLLVLRVNIWPVLASALSAIHETAVGAEGAFGWGTLAGVPVVAGGAMGKRGDIIVDNIYQPTRIIGVVDGRGKVIFKYRRKDMRLMRLVTKEINRRRLLPKNL